MTAAAVAQRLGLSEAAVAAFSGTGAEFAQFFGKSLKEGEAAVADLATPPAAPTAVVATVTNPTTVSLAFTAGANGGSPITGYTAISAPAVTLTAVAPTDVTSPVVFTGAFAAGVAYTFQLRATNAVGQSPLSSSSAAVTPNP